MIKKVLLVGFVFSVLFGFSMSVGAYEQVDTLSITDVCMKSFSNSQVSTVKKIYDLFNTYADVVELKYPGTSSLVVDYLKTTKATLYCNGVGFGNYKEFELATIMLLKNVSGGVVEQAESIADPEAEKAILDLQKHLANLIGARIDYDRPFQHTADLDFEMVAGMSGEKMEASIGFDSVGKYDLNKNAFDANLALDFDVNVVGKNLVDFDYSNDTGDSVSGLVDMQIDGNLDVDILQKDDMFVKLNDVDVNIGSETMSDDERMIFDIMKGTYMGIVDGLKGQYINITDGALDEKYREKGINPLDLGVNKMANVIKKLETKPFMKFSKTDENNKWEGVFTDDLCKEFANIFPIQYLLFFGPRGCEEFQQGFLDKTDGKEYLVMEKNGSDYNVGFSEILTDTTDYEGIIIWNADDLKKIEFSFEDNGSFLYENNQLDVSYDDGITSLDIDGVLGSNTKTFDINFVIDEETQTILNGSIVYKKIGLTFDLSADFTVMEEGVQVAEFSLKDKELITYLKSLNIDAPEYAKTLTEIEKLFGGF